MKRKKRILQEIHSVSPDMINIYVIKNKKQEIIYIGQTEKPVSKRLDEHLHNGFKGADVTIHHIATVSKPFANRVEAGLIKELSNICNLTNKIHNKIGNKPNNEVVKNYSSHLSNNRCIRCMRTIPLKYNSSDFCSDFCKTQYQKDLERAIELENRDIDPLSWWKYSKCEKCHKYFDVNDDRWVLEYCVDCGHKVIIDLFDKYDEDDVKNEIIFDQVTLSTDVIEERKKKVYWSNKYVASILGHN